MRFAGHDTSSLVDSGLVRRAKRKKKSGMHGRMLCAHQSARGLLEKMDGTGRRFPVWVVVSVYLLSIEMSSVLPAI
jgi:hypothetical protein